MKLSEYRMEIGLIAATVLFTGAIYGLNALRHWESPDEQAAASIIRIDDTTTGNAKANFTVVDPKHPEVLLDHATGCLYRKEPKAKRLVIMNSPTGKPLCNS